MKGERHWTTREASRLSILAIACSLVLARAARSTITCEYVGVGCNAGYSASASFQCVSGSLLKIVVTNTSTVDDPQAPANNVLSSLTLSGASPVPSAGDGAVVAAGSSVENAGLYTDCSGAASGPDVTCEWSAGSNFCPNCATGGDPACPTPISECGLSFISSRETSDVNCDTASNFRLAPGVDIDNQPDGPDWGLINLPTQTLPGAGVEVIDDTIEVTVDVGTCVETSAFCEGCATFGSHFRHACGPPVTTTSTSTTSSTTQTSTTSTTTTTGPTPVCGNGVKEAGEQCDDNDPQSVGCCTDCVPLAGGTTCGPNPSACAARQCDGAGTCGTVPLPSDTECGPPRTQCSRERCDGAGACGTRVLPNGTPCDDGDICTEDDRCDGSDRCTGGGGPDTDNDGECDAKEIACGCNFNDDKEGCLLPNRLVGRAGNGGGEVLMTWHTPTSKRIDMASDPSCSAAGVCTAGRCAQGKIQNVCVTDADCNEPPDTCRVIVNWAATSDLVLEYARRPVRAASGDVETANVVDFAPVTPGCSRRVDVSFDPGLGSTALRLRAKGTVDGRLRKDRDSFRYRR